MISGIDHIVILVDELEAAIAVYRSLGFTVTPGGKHPRGTHNALVSFQDGSYFELIAFWEPTDASQAFHRHRAIGPGIISFALAADGLEETVAAIRAHGLPYGDPRPGARQRLDGVEIAWKMAFLPNDEGPLPFLIEDVTNRSLRVPGGEATEHSNGATGISRLIIAVDDLTTAIGLFAGLATASASPEHDAI